MDRRAGEHTETLALEQWAAHKRAFLRLRQLSCLSPLATALHRWRRASRAQVLTRRRAQLQQALLFPGAQLEAGAALAQLRAARATGVQPRRDYAGTAEWAEQQGIWRARKAQPQLEAAVAALVRVAEGVCTQVEARARDMLESVRPSELQDRIGVRQAGDPLHVLSVCLSGGWALDPTNACLPACHARGMLHTCTAAAAASCWRQGLSPACRQPGALLPATMAQNPAGRPGGCHLQGTGPLNAADQS